MHTVKNLFTLIAINDVDKEAMPWKFDQQTKTEGDSEIERLVGAIEDARFIARMIVSDEAIS